RPSNGWSGLLRFRCENCVILSEYGNHDQTSPGKEGGSTQRKSGARSGRLEQLWRLLQARIAVFARPEEKPGSRLVPRAQRHLRAVRPPAYGGIGPRSVRGMPQAWIRTLCEREVACHARLSRYPIQS